MTCIIAFHHNDRVVLAGDKIAVSGCQKTISQQPKVFHNGDFMIGYTSSFRMGQILKFKWQPPKIKKGQTAENYLHTDTIDSIRKVFEDNWFLDKTKNGWGTFIICYENKIFQISDDLGVIENVEHIESCGCGRELARGALTILLEYETDYKVILKKLYRTVSANMTAVSSEFDYITSDKKGELNGTDKA